jgi:hypothetical protein
MIFSENRFPLFRIMLRPKSSGSKWLPVPQPRVERSVTRQRESLIGVAWGARPKPGPDSPANVSKRGLSARHYVPNQTLIMVNARLPKGNLAAGNRGNPASYGSRTRVPNGVPTPIRQTPPQGPQVRIPAAQCTRGFARALSLRIQRAQGKPGARCTRGLACKMCTRTRTRAYRFSGEHPAFPAQWFYGL